MLNQIDTNIVRDFYNKHPSCWASDRFSQMTTKFIDKVVNNVLRSYSADSLILNAGSGGKQYKTSAQQVLMDIAENTLINVPNGIVGDVENIPFSSETFDCVICVGTVINYCDAEKAIMELSRVSKSNAILIVEYERSESGFIDENHRGDDVLVFKHKYFGEEHMNLLYSDAFVDKLLDTNGLIVLQSNLFNSTIPWAERFLSEKLTHSICGLEPLFRRIRSINVFSHNRIVICKKK